MVQIPHALELHVTSPCTMVPFNLTGDKQSFKIIYIRSGGSPPQPVWPKSIHSTIQLNAWVADNLTTADILFLSVIL